ncbi:glucokinase [Clostridia bacterium]|nr:glucokinase [Clostridia bacterium]
MEQYAIGIDVGGTKTAYGLFDSGKTLLSKRRHQSDKNSSPEAFFDEIVRNVNEILSENNLTVTSLRGIGIGMPSYINFEEGHIVKTSNLTNIRDFAAKEYLHARLGRDVRIIIDNDAHTAAIAEHKYGAGRGFDNMLYCPVSTGISSGIIIDGKLFRGRYGWAGESGHMIITPGQGIECGCGNRGCLMSWCSGGMITRHIQRWIDNGEDTLMLSLAGTADQITTVQLNQAWEMNDPMARKALEQMAQYMAVWLYNLYVLLNINCYVFGGGLVEMGDKLFWRIRELFDAYNQNDQPVYFRFAELNQDYGIIGATELLFS